MLKKFDLKGTSIIWIYGVGCFFLFNLMSFLIFTSFARQLYPGSEPPWYFIIQDFIGGSTMLAYLLTCVIAGLIAVRKGNRQGRFLIFFSLIWASLPIWSLLIIFLKTKNIFDPASRISAWQTFDQYLADPVRLGGYLILVFIVLVAFLLNKFKWVKVK